MDYKLQTYLDLLGSPDQESSAEAARLLHHLLDWKVSRDESLQKELLIQEPVRSLTGAENITNVELTPDHFIKFLLENLAKQSIGYEWVPFILKSQAANKEIRKGMISYLAKHWSEDEVLAAQIIMMYIDFPITEQENSLLNEFLKNGQTVELVSCSENYLKIQNELDASA